MRQSLPTAGTKGSSRSDGTSFTLYEIAPVYKVYTAVIKMAIKANKTGMKAKQETFIKGS